MRFVEYWEMRAVPPQRATRPATPALARLRYGRFYAWCRAALRGGLHGVSGESPPVGVDYVPEYEREAAALVVGSSSASPAGVDVYRGVPLVTIDADRYESTKGLQASSVFYRQYQAVVCSADGQRLAQSAHAVRPS